MLVQTDPAFYKKEYSSFLFPKSHHSIKASARKKYEIIR